MTKRITISLPKDIVEEIDGNLEYGDSRSAWIQEAIECRLESEGGDTGNQNRGAANAD